ncbi:hypothetical protein OIU84_018565 [Salix udensis]|uniref:Uncharacterized protein n=1 Tax=Salix udensis TaxID=889485 RepID=A0AAD6KZ72_9ROSI|nr:hypothetical protein OIU84_018565 [Salix udensis]
MFLSGATDKTVFITSTGSTPSAALGKLESPISTRAREILALDFARLKEEEEEEEERKESLLEAIHLHIPELEQTQSSFEINTKAHPKPPVCKPRFIGLTPTRVDTCSASLS